MLMRYTRNPGFYYVGDSGAGNGGTGTGTGGTGTGSNTGDNSGNGNQSNNNNAGGSNNNTNQNNNTGGNDGDNNANNNTNNNDADKDKNKSGNSKDDKKFSQSDLDTAIADRLKREKDKQEADKLKNQGEFEKLYNTQQPEFVRLQGVETEHKSLVETLNGSIDEKIKDWDPDLKATDPGKDNFKLRQVWFDKTEKIQLKLSGTNQQVINGEHGSKGNDGKATAAVDGYLGSRYTDPRTQK